MSELSEILSNIINIFIDLIPRTFVIGTKEGGYLFYNNQESFFLWLIFVSLFIIFSYYFKKVKKINIITKYPIWNSMIISILIIVLVFLIRYSFNKDGDNRILLKPGIHIYWPVVSEYKKISIQKDSINIEAQGITTKDNKTLIVNGVIFYNINDVKYSLIEYNDIVSYLHDKGLTTINSIFSNINSNDIHNKIMLQNMLQNELERNFPKKLFSMLNIDITDIAEGVILKTNGDSGVIYLDK